MDEIGVVKKSLRYLSKDEREENIGTWIIVVIIIMDYELWPLNYNSNHNYEFWIMNSEFH